jgi:hypothetical protein
MPKQYQESCLKDTEIDIFDGDASEGELFVYSSSEAVAPQIYYLINYRDDYDVVCYYLFKNVKPSDIDFMSVRLTITDRVKSELVYKIPVLNSIDTVFYMFSWDLNDSFNSYLELNRENLISIIDEVDLRI